MSQLHRFALAYDLLEGDWDARMVLADLLSDEGEDELVEFARTYKRINRLGDLELVVRLLPARQAILLGCAFLERGMTGKGNIRRHAWLIARLAQVRRLLKNGEPVEKIIAQGRALTAYQVALRPGHLDDSLLQEAAHSLGNALDQLETESAATLAVASLARSMRRKARFQNELGWQVEQTQDVLARLLADWESEGAPNLVDNSLA